VTLFRYGFCLLIYGFFYVGLAQTTPWQRLEYLCTNQASITQITASPQQITLIFNDTFYPMKQVGTTQDAGLSARYESDTKLRWILEEGVGRLEQEDGTLLAEGCISQNSSVQQTPASLNYRCKDDVSISVFYVNEIAQISVTDPSYGDQTYELPRATSASGAKFSNGATTWFVKGEEGNLFEEAEEVQHAEACKLIVSGSTIKTLTGTVTYLPRVALPENAVVQVQVQDVSLQDVVATVLAEQRIETNGQQVPVLFSLSYDETKLEPNHSYALSVRITVGDTLLFINTQQVRVLGEGYPSDNVEVRVEQVQ
jgi:putative lipoprotein